MMYEPPNPLLPELPFLPETGEWLLKEDLKKKNPNWKSFIQKK